MQGLEYDIGLIVVFFVSIPAVILFRYLTVPRPFSNKSHVGPTYWGIYSGKSLNSAETIELKKPTFDDIITAGSGKYAQGKAVKSLRG